MERDWRSSRTAAHALGGLGQLGSRARVQLPTLAYNAAVFDLGWGYRLGARRTWFAGFSPGLEQLAVT